MPSPDIVCEFCQAKFRKDAYPVHVRAKHEKEITQLLLEDFKDNNVTTIAAYALSLSVKSMPIHSKLYQDAEYWFGIKPLFYIRETADPPHDPNRPDTQLKPSKEDQELSAYLKREENTKAHREFVEGILKGISLLDFIAFQKNVVVRSPDVQLMRRELTALKEEHKQQVEYSTKEIERLKHEVEMWRETVDEEVFIGDLKRSLASARANELWLEEEAKNLREELGQLEEKHGSQWTSLNTARLREISALEERDAVNRREIDRLKVGLEKAQAAVKKEAQKLFDREVEAKRKAKEKKALAKLKAQKAARKAKKLAETSDSDSNSDSDSADSDSDSD